VPLIPTRLAPRGLGDYGQRELVSVVIPGTLILIEVWLLLFSPEKVDRAGGYLKLASDQIGGANDWILTAALLLVALAAYTVGLLARMLAWFLFNLYRKTRFPSGITVRQRFVDEHGEPAVARALAAHDALRHALQGQEHDAFFQYAKLWLRQTRPQLAVEHHESEINFLVAIEGPLLGAAFVAWRQAGWIWSLPALATACSLMFLLFRKGLARSKDETFDVMRNFLFAQWYAEAAPRQASSSARR